METKEYSYVDKSGWHYGEWTAEPDKIQWPDSETGLPCLIVRGPGGALCGYVGVPDTHPWHGKAYGDAVGTCTEDCSDDSHWSHSVGSQLQVHDGLTFSDACSHSADERGICHIPGPGEPDNVWWFGFDCAHSGDFSPKYERHYGPSGYESYRNVEYVRYEVTSLARQLAEIKS